MSIVENGYKGKRTLIIFKTLTSNMCTITLFMSFFIKNYFTWIDGREPNNITKLETLVLPLDFKQLSFSSWFNLT